MYALLSLLILVPVAADPADIPQVRGLLVTHLGFEQKDREEVAATAIKLLSSCHSSCASKEDDFEKIFRQCHLHVKFSKPQKVTAGPTQKMKVDELVVSFPTNTGGIWVRSGEDYNYFTKFEYKHCLALHELMKAGKPE
jgi:hypothetical protein